MGPILALQDNNVLPIAIARRPARRIVEMAITAVRGSNVYRMALAPQQGQLIVEMVVTATWALCACGAVAGSATLGPAWSYSAISGVDSLPSS